MVLVLLSLACGERAPARFSNVTTALYSRVDTNATTVWSPRTHVAGRVGGASLDAVYALDAWTSASIDIVTAATKPVHEVRHELDVGAGYELDDLTFSSRYRYSIEPDYESHGLVLGTTLAFAQNNTTVDLRAIGARDTVGRAGDPLFHERQKSFGGRVTLTQLIDRRMYMQLSWELTAVLGYQASPYRYVAVGGAGTCASDAPFCLPEKHPDERTRQALVLRARRALSDHTSVGFEYRFYGDSWGVFSQTLMPDLSILIGESAALTFSYRYYTQSEADFYRPRYLDARAIPAHFTRDRELSALYAHRASLGYSHDVELGRTSLSLAVRTSGTLFRYLAFVGLDRVEALEVTGLLGLRLP